MQEDTKQQAEGKIVARAIEWRERDIDAIADKTNEKKRAEYHAKQRLRDAIDQARKN